MVLSVKNKSSKALRIILPPGLIASGASGQFGGGGFGGAGGGGLGGGGGGLGGGAVAACGGAAAWAAVAAASGGSRPGGIGHTARLDGDDHAEPADHQLLRRYG